MQAFLKVYQKRVITVRQRDAAGEWNGKPGPIQPVKLSTRKPSILKISTVRGVQRKSISCFEKLNHFYFYFYLILMGLLNHAHPYPTDNTPRHHHVPLLPRQPRCFTTYQHSMASMVLIRHWKRAWNQQGAFGLVQGIPRDIVGVTASEELFEMDRGGLGSCVEERGGHRWQVCRPGGLWRRGRWCQWMYEPVGRPGSCCLGV